jgi:hypothetical protein
MQLIYNKILIRLAIILAGAFNISAMNTAQGRVQSDTLKVDSTTESHYDAEYLFNQDNLDTVASELNKNLADVNLSATAAITDNQATIIINGTLPDSKGKVPLHKVVMPISRSGVHHSPLAVQSAIRRRTDEILEHTKRLERDYREEIKKVITWKLQNATIIIGIIYRISNYLTEELSKISVKAINKFLTTKSPNKNEQALKKQGAELFQRASLLQAISRAIKKLNATTDKNMDDEKIILKKNYCKLFEQLLEK